MSVTSRMGLNLTSNVPGGMTVRAKEANVQKIKTWTAEKDDALVRDVMKDVKEDRKVTARERLFTESDLACKGGIWGPERVEQAVLYAEDILSSGKWRAHVRDGRTDNPIGDLLDKIRASMGVKREQQGSVTAAMGGAGLPQSGPTVYEIETFQPQWKNGYSRLRHVLSRLLRLVQMEITRVNQELE